MSFNITYTNFLNRAKDLSRNNLLFIFSIIKAASIGLGVATFLNLFIDLGAEWSPERCWIQLPKFLLWVTSYGGLLVTFDTAMFASLFLIHIPKRSETFFTFLLVGLEALQFALLKPATDKSVIKVMSIDLMVWWYAVFGIYCLTISGIIFFGKQDINPKNFTGFSDLVEEYIDKFKFGLVLALLGSISSFAIFFILAFTSIDNYYIIIFSSVSFSLALYFAFEIHHAQRKKIELQLRSNSIKKKRSKDR
jgi:hypothetical protein